MQEHYPLGVREVAKLARKSPSRIRALVRAGEIQCHRTGPRGWIFFTEADIQALLASTLVPARSELARGGPDAA